MLEIVLYRRLRLEMKIVSSGDRVAVDPLQSQAPLRGRLDGADWAGEQ